MRILFVLTLPLLLGGCLQSFKLNPPWPNQTDAELLKPCERLLIIEDTKTVTLAEMVAKVQDNYNIYHECSLKNDSWIKWYNTHWKKDK